jgi:hypothetical protein
LQCLDILRAWLAYRHHKNVGVPRVKPFAIATQLTGSCNLKAKHSRGKAKNKRPRN